MARTLGRTARTLDRLVEATNRVEAGDYSVRVSADVQGLPIGAGAGRRVRHDGRPPRDRRAPAPEPARRRQPRAPDPDGGRAGQSRGDPRRRLSGRRRAPRRDPRRDARAGPAHRRPADPRAVRGRNARPPPEPTDPEVVVGEVVRSFEPTAAAAGITLSTAIEGDLPILDVDPVRIREVLANLVANAIRHTPARRPGDDRRRGRVRRPVAHGSR